jgi:ankyrin repeat protein
VRGFTPLHIAIQEKNMLMIKLLLDHQDIDVNYNNNKLKVSPLHMAAIYNYNNPEIIQLLLNSKKINVNIKNEKGFTPLCTAIHEKNMVMIESLLEHQDIDINSYDVSNSTPLMMAIMTNNIVAVQAIIENKGLKDINHNQTKFGYAPIHSVAYKGNIEMMRLLLNHP